MAPSIPPYLPVAASYVPTHNELFHVSFADGDFASSLITQKVRTLIHCNFPESRASTIRIQFDCCGVNATLRAVLIASV